MGNGKLRGDARADTEKRLGGVSARRLREGEPAQDMQSGRCDHRCVLQALQRQGGAVLRVGGAFGKHDPHVLRAGRGAGLRGIRGRPPCDAEASAGSLELKARGTLETTVYLYSRRDLYELLVFRSYGTPYEGFLEELVAEEDRTTFRMLELIHGAEKARSVISKEALHTMNHAFYSALSETIVHAESEEELRATTEVISTFFNAGWERYRMP